MTRPFPGNGVRRFRRSSVGDDRQRDGDHGRFRRVERSQHPELVNHIHGDAEQQNARNRREALTKAACRLRRIEPCTPEERLVSAARVLDAVVYRRDRRHRRLQEEAECHGTAETGEHIGPESLMDFEG